MEIYVILNHDGLIVGITAEAEIANLLSQSYQVIKTTEEQFRELASYYW